MVSGRYGHFHRRRSPLQRFICSLGAIAIMGLLVGCGSTGTGQTAPTLIPTPSPAAFGTPGPPGSQTLLTYTGHSAGVISMVWSPDGTRVASASDDGTVQVWNPMTGVQYWSQAIDAYAFAVAWSPDGKYVAGGGQYGIVMVLDSASGKTVATYNSQTGNIEGLVWSPDGKRLAFGDGTGTVQIWDTLAGKLLLTCTGHQGAVAHVAWSPDGTRVASAGYDGTVRIWDAATCRQLLVYTGHGEPVWAVAWSPDGKYIASGTGAAGVNGPVMTHNSVKIWNAQTGQTLLTYAPNPGEYYAVSWSPNGKYIAAGGDDHTVSLFDSVTGRTIQVYRGHTDIIWTAVWSRDGMKMASGSQDGIAQIWKPTVG